MGTIEVNVITIVMQFCVTQVAFEIALVLTRPELQSIAFLSVLIQGCLYIYQFEFVFMNVIVVFNTYNCGLHFNVLPL